MIQGVSEPSHDPPPKPCCQGTAGLRPAERPQRSWATGGEGGGSFFERLHRWRAAGGGAHVSRHLGLLLIQASQSPEHDVFIHSWPQKS